MSNFNKNCNVMTNFKMFENSVLWESSYSMQMDRQMDDVKMKTVGFHNSFVNTVKEYTTDHILCHI
jgi:hypothetical protein